MNVIEELEKNQIAKLTEKRAIPDFGPGDTLRIKVNAIGG
jgi:large subunit ribosomal protein L19